VSNAVISVLHIEAPAVPRGARLVDGLMSLFEPLLRAPKRRVPTRAEEAAAVREMAIGLQASDPSFAADLMAAANRHEIDD
jgi:hypothetical protein